MPTRFIPVGEWLPDIPPFNNPGALTAKNVIPAQSSYRSFPKTTNVSTNTLGGRCQGAIVAIDNNNNSYDFAGDASALYSLVTGNSYSNVSRLAGGAYATTSDAYWEFTQWGNTVIGVNGRLGDVPQQISLGAANFANMTGGPDRAGHISVVRDFVVIGATSASPQEVRWSAINNANSWTADPATLADSQLLLGDGGFVQRVIGGEYGIILQERAIYRMTFAGSPLVFQFDQVHRGIGALTPQSVSYYKNLVFFLAEDGFYAFDGSNVVPIGENKVDRTFFNMLDLSALSRITSSIDPINKLVAWAFKSTDSTVANNNSDRILIYNWAQNRWAMVEDVNIEILTRLKALGYTLDSLDNFSTNLDSIQLTLDSPAWNSGSTLLASFNQEHRVTTFDGSAMPAVVDTTEQQLHPEHRGMVREVWPVTHGASATNITVAPLTRDLFTANPSTGSSMTANSTGFAALRSNARYHRFRIATADGTEFEDIQGVVIDSTPEGMR